MTSEVRAQAEGTQAVGGEARAVPLGAQDDDLDVVAGRLGQPCVAERVEAPLEHVALDDQGARHRALAGPLRRRPGVDQQRTVGDPGRGLLGADPGDAPARLRQQLVDRPGPFGPCRCAHQSTPACSVPMRSSRPCSTRYVFMTDSRGEYTCTLTAASVPTLRTWWT